MHDSSGDQKAAVVVLKRVVATRDGNPMLGSVDVSVNDVIFTTNQHARRSIVAVGGCQLSSRNLHEHTCAWVSGFAPLAYHVVQTKIQLVVGEHLHEIHVNAIWNQSEELITPSPHF